MQPRPRAETVGTCFPSFRCFIGFCRSIASGCEWDERSRCVRKMAFSRRAGHCNCRANHVPLPGLRQREMLPVIRSPAGRGGSTPPCDGGTFATTILRRVFFHRGGCFVRHPGQQSEEPRTSPGTSIDFPRFSVAGRRLWPDAHGGLARRCPAAIKSPQATGSVGIASVPRSGRAQRCRVAGD